MKRRIEKKYVFTLFGIGKIYIFKIKKWKNEKKEEEKEKKRREKKKRKERINEKLILNYILIVLNSNNFI